MDVNERIAALEAELQRLKQTVANVETEQSSRRHLFKKMGAVAAGAMAGGTALALAGANAASAANGDAVTVGQSKSGTALTTLTGSGFDVQGSAAPNLGGDPYLPNKIPVITGDDVGTTNSIALYGTTQGAGSIGVAGRNTLAGTGVFASSESGVGLEARSTTGPAIHITETGFSRTIPPADGTWLAGSLLVKNGDLYYCYQGGIGPASLWRRLSAPNLTLLASPLRTYDSRADTANGKISGGQTRVVDLSATRDSPPLPVVPAGASGALFNLTATQETTTGFLAAFSNAVANWPGTSNLNFSAGVDIANQVTSAIDGNNKVKIYCGGASGVATHFIVDVIGYF